MRAAVAFVGAATLLGVAAPDAVGAPVAGPVTYTCVDSKGNKRSSDRPIPECSDREQRVLNKDGSVRRVIPPTPEPPKPRASGQG